MGGIAVAKEGFIDQWEGRGYRGTKKITLINSPVGREH